MSLPVVLEQQDPRNIEYLERKFQVLVSQKRYKEVIQCCKMILEIKPDAVCALNNIGLAYHRIGDVQESLSWYERALSINPNHIVSLYNKGRSLIDVERYEEARACFDRLTDELGQSQDPDILLEKGLTLVELNRNEEALIWLDKCLQSDPDNCYAHLNKARALSV